MYEYDAKRIRRWRKLHEDPGPIWPEEDMRRWMKERYDELWAREDQREAERAGSEDRRE